MSKSSEALLMRGDEAIEALLEHAVARPTPPREDEAIIRDAVHAEWRAVTGRIRTRRRVTNLAVAATVLLAIALSFNALQVTDVASVQIATISKDHGTVYLLGEQSELREMTDLEEISTGQIIVTGDGAGIGLDWRNGGSLRVDQNTRIEFTSADSAYLQSGRIYFDTQGGTVTATAGSGLEVLTDHGSVTHVGTQFMTAVSPRDLTVSVREGRVEVDGQYVDPKFALAGEQLTVSAGAQPTVVNIPRYGEAWSWIETTAPAVNVDGRSVNEFLQWVGRETGLQIVYESPGAQQIAHDGILRGSVDMDPRDELRFRMSGEDLNYRIEGGTIYVSALD